MFDPGGFGAAAERLQRQKRPTLRGGEGAEATAAGGSGRQQGTAETSAMTARRPDPLTPALLRSFFG